MKFPEEDGRVYSSGAEDGVTGLLKRPQCPRLISGSTLEAGVASG